MKLRKVKEDPSSYASKYSSKATLGLAEDKVRQQFSSLGYDCGVPPPPPHMVVSRLICPASST
jgi:hypothetical protein